MTIHPQLEPRVLILLYISEKDGKKSLLHNVSLPL